jgi:hypothetical protein
MQAGPLVGIPAQDSLWARRTGVLLRRTVATKWAAALDPDAQGRMQAHRRRGPGVRTRDARDHKDQGSDG